MSTFLVWPQRGFVDYCTIETWFLDAVANNQIGPEHFRARTEHEMALALQDAGLVTLGNPANHHRKDHS